MGRPLGDVDVETAYRRYYPLLREKCRRMLRNAAAAEDVAQETFVKMWRSEIAGGDPRQVTAWLYRTSTRLAIDRLREDRRRGEPLSDEPAEQDFDSLAPPSDEALATRQHLLRLVAALPADELEMAFLSRIDGLTQQEIAEIYKMSDRTVRRCLQRLDQRVEALSKKRPR